METKFNLKDLFGLQADVDNGFSYVDDGVIVVDNFKRIPVEVSSFKLDMVTFLICKTGRLQVNINGKSFLVEKENLLICSNWHFLSDALFSADFTCTILAFSNERMDALLASFGNNMKDYIYLNENPVIKFNEIEMKVVHAYHQFMKTKLSVPRYSYFAETMHGIVVTALYDLFSVVERVRQENKAVANVNCAYSNPIVKNFLMMLASEATKARSVSYYAKKLCVTPKYLSSLCSKETGKAPSHWIRDFLIERIKFMLTSTNLSCKEISVQLEFPNSSFFGKYAKQCLGCSPLEYRKRNKK